MKFWGNTETGIFGLVSNIKQTPKTQHQNIKTKTQNNLVQHYKTVI